MVQRPPRDRRPRAQDTPLRPPPAVGEGKGPTKGKPKPRSTERRGGERAPRGAGRTAGKRPSQSWEARATSEDPGRAAFPLSTLGNPAKGSPPRRPASGNTRPARSAEWKAPGGGRARERKGRAPARSRGARSYLRSGARGAGARRPPRRPGRTAAAAPGPGPCRGPWGPGGGPGTTTPVGRASVAFLRGASQDGPFRGTRGRLLSGRGAGGRRDSGTRALESSRRDEREGRTAGAQEAGSPLARPDGQSEARQAPPAGGTRRRWAWRAGSRGPGPGAPLVPGLASRSRPRACASGRLAAKVAPGGVQPHPPSENGSLGTWSGVSRSGRHCAPPAPRSRPVPAPAAREPHE